jgi:ABC-2 type transport system permease protein
MGGIEDKIVKEKTCCRMKKNQSFFLKSILREANRISKDHTLILSLLLAPIFYAFFYGSIYLNKTESEVAIAIVDNDKSSLSREYIRMIVQDQRVKVGVFSTDLEHAKLKFMNLKVQGILNIEKGFESNLKRMQNANVGLILNTSRFLPSNDINKTVSAVSVMVGAGLRVKYFELHGNNSELSLKEAMPISIDNKSIFLNHSTYGGFLLPGLLLIILQQTFLIGLAESIAREREKKTFMSWLKLSDGKIWHAIYGKGFFFLFLYFCYTLFFHAVNYSVLDLKIEGSIILLSFLIFIFFNVTLMFGSFFGSLFSKEIWALQFFAFSTYPIFLLAGYSWPTSAMNDVLQLIANMLPTTPVLEAYSAIVFKGAGFKQIYGDLLHLFSLGVFYGLLAFWRLRRLRNKELFQTKSIVI